MAGSVPGNSRPSTTARKYRPEAAHQQHPPPARPDPGDRLAGRAPGTEPRRTARTGRRRRGGGAGRGLAAPRSAWPCRRPCRGTRASSRPRRSRRRGVRRRRARPRSCPTPSAPPARGAAVRRGALARHHPTAAGSRCPRARRPGGAGARRTMRTSGNVPGACSPPTCTSLLSRVRPRAHPCARAPRSGPRPTADQSPGSVRARSRSWSATSRSNRSWTTALATWSSIVRGARPGPRRVLERVRLVEPRSLERRRACPRSPPRSLRGTRR